jgi:hypothetical protein
VYPKEDDAAASRGDRFRYLRIGSTMSGFSKMQVASVPLQRQNARRHAIHMHNRSASTRRS